MADKDMPGGLHSVMRNNKSEWTALVVVACLFTACGYLYLFGPEVRTDFGSRGGSIMIAALGGGPLRVGRVQIFDVESSKLVFDAISEDGYKLEGFNGRLGMNKVDWWSAKTNFSVVVPGREAAISDPKSPNLLKTVPIEGFILEAHRRYEVRVCSLSGLDTCVQEPFILR